MVQEGCTKVNPQLLRAAQRHGHGRSIPFSSRRNKETCRRKASVYGTVRSMELNGSIHRRQHRSRAVPSGAVDDDDDDDEPTQPALTSTASMPSSGAELMSQDRPLPLRRSTRTRYAPPAFHPVTIAVRASVPSSEREHTATLSPAVASSGEAERRATAAASKRRQRKRGRLCKTDGCDNYIVHNGLCCRHGGGKRCSVDGCGASAKHKGLCWRHGGSTECKVDGCTKKAKAKGVCWSHGGGTPCSHDGCTKIAVSGGACWAHGGGKRCIHDGCQRPAFERTCNFCEKHYRELQDIDYYEV